jgi:hypothetical protein
MQLALRKLRENKKANLHNRLKIPNFLDYLEKDFEKATSPSPNPRGHPKTSLIAYNWWSILGN